MKRILISLLVFALIGCGETTYNGEAFVKNGSDTVKLSDMEIVLTTGKDLLANSISYKANVDKLVTGIQSKGAKLEIIQAQKKNFDSMSLVFLSNENALKPIDPNILPAAQKILEEIKNLYLSKKAELDAEIEQIKAGVQPAIFFDPALQNIKLKTRTNAEGKFSFKIKEEEDLVLVANSGASFWYISLPKEKRDIALADSNLHNAKCSTCFFSQEKSALLTKEIQSYAVEKIAASSVGITKLSLSSEDETLNTELEALSKKFKGIPARVGEITQNDGLANMIASSGGFVAEMRARNKSSAIQLEIDVVKLRAKNDELLKTFLKRVTELKSELSGA
jgi:hypothetical protein